MAAFAHNWLRVSNHGGEWRGCSLLVALSRDIDNGDVDLGGPPKQRALDLFGFRWPSSDFSMHRTFRIVWMLAGFSRSRRGGTAFALPIAGREMAIPGDGLWARVKPYLPSPEGKLRRVTVTHSMIDCAVSDLG